MMPQHAKRPGGNRAKAAADVETQYDDSTTIVTDLHPRNAAALKLSERDQAWFALGSMIASEIEADVPEHKIADVTDLSYFDELLGSDPVRALIRDLYDNERVYNFINDFDEKGKPKHGLVARLAADIGSTFDLAKDVDGHLYRFSAMAGRYVPAENDVRRFATQRIEQWSATKAWSSHRLSEVIERLRIDALRLWDRPPEGVINVRDGLITFLQNDDGEVFGWELKPHSPDHLSTVQIPVSYDQHLGLDEEFPDRASSDAFWSEWPDWAPGTQAEFLERNGYTSLQEYLDEHWQEVLDDGCPAWERFIADTFPDDAQHVAWQIIADLLTPNRDEQVAILLIGEGANGKSVFLNALTALVGRENVSSVPLQKIEHDNFAASRLVGKLANIAPDLPSTHLQTSATFKAITGGDVLHAERKYRDSFEFQPFCRLIFSANQMPRANDASQAFFRRWIVIPFDRSFEHSDAIPASELLRRLTQPHELAAALDKALAVLAGWSNPGHNPGHRFTESPSMLSAKQEFRSLADPLAAWLSRVCLEFVQGLVAKNELYEAYRRHCEREGFPVLTQKAFTVNLRRIRPKIESARRMHHGVRTWVWTGIGWKAD